MPATRTRKAKALRFTYPDEPQRLSLNDVLPPEGGDGDGRRYQLPKVIITAEIARAFCERVAEEHNRKERKTNVDAFVRKILGKKLRNTHQGLAFNVRGELSDGQHRMKALALYAEDHPDAEIVMDIHYNLPIDDAFAFDGGAKRSNVDHAMVGGVDHAAVVSRLVRLLYQVRETEGRPANFKDVQPLQPDEIVEWSKKYGSDLFDAWETVRPLRAVKGLNLNAAAVFVFLALETSPSAPVAEFVNGLATMDWAYKDDPRKVVYRWATNSIKYRTDVRAHLAHLIMTWNDFVHGRGREVNKWLPAWGIPKVEAPPAKPARKAVSAARRKPSTRARV